MKSIGAQNVGTKTPEKRIKNKPPKLIKLIFDHLKVQKVKGSTLRPSSYCTEL